MTAGVTNTTAASDWGKADFEAIYNCPDPRRYFTTLHPWTTRFRTTAKRCSVPWPRPFSGTAVTARR